MVKARLAVVRNGSPAADPAAPHHTIESLEPTGGFLKGARFEVTKEMSTDIPRRIVRLATYIWLPVSHSVDRDDALERAARTCPVHKSLHPSIDGPVVLHWTE